jgi:hypothetical protein
LQHSALFSCFKKIHDSYQKRKCYDEWREQHLFSV